jgi:hypothetical protein
MADIGKAKGNLSPITVTMAGIPAAFEHVIEIPTTSQQDQSVAKWGDSKAGIGISCGYGDYDAFNRNCSTFVLDALRAGKVSLKGYTPELYPPSDPAEAAMDPTGSIPHLLLDTPHSIFDWAVKVPGGKELRKKNWTIK